MFKKGLSLSLGSSMRCMELGPSNCENTIFAFFFYSRMNPFSLIIALDERGEASGSLFWDDGDSVGK